MNKFYPANKIFHMSEQNLYAVEVLYDSCGNFIIFTHFLHDAN